MRLIDADALKKCAIPCQIHNGALTDLCVPLYQIDNAPTVAERLIRCKDCKHTVLSEDGKTLICCLTMRVGTVRPNFYCGNGEMKGGAE